MSDGATFRARQKPHDQDMTYGIRQSRPETSGQLHSEQRQRDNHGLGQATESVLVWIVRCIMVNCAWGYVG